MALVNAFGDISLEATQQDVKTAVDAINTKTPALSGGRVPVDGSGVDQPITAVSLPLPTGAATETTLGAIQALHQEIKDLNDNILYVLTGMYEKMPRVTGNDQAAVSVEAGTLSAVTAVTTVTTVATLTNQAQIGGQDALTVARSQMAAGTYHIYSNIVVS